MKQQKRLRRIAFFIGACLFVNMWAGCGRRVETVEATIPYATAVSMEDTPIVDYAMPQLTPNILINRCGYLTGGGKVAAMKGSQAFTTFRLVDAVTNEVVYQAEPEDITYDEETQVYVGYADFSQYDEIGSYYLEADDIGRSYTFTIEEELYARLFGELYACLVADCESMTISVSEAVVLLMAYEWYPQIFADEDSDQIPDILTVFRQWIFQKLEKSAVEEDVLFAAFLAKYSYLYQKFDKEFATDCLRQASAIYEKSQKNMHEDAISFFALTELYRATGTYSYRNQILGYKAYFENSNSLFEEQEYLYGAMTYVVTRQKVDVEMCESFMSKLMDRGEEIAECYKDMVHATDAKNNGCDELLKRGFQLSCANYVLNNYKYNRIMEELADYLMGRNLKSVCFFPDEGMRNGYISLLAQLMAVHSKT